MSDHHAPAPASAEDAALAAPPDAQNPALIDLKKTFKLTMLLFGLFVGAVIVFVLR